MPPDERESPEIILRSLRRSVGLAFRARRDGVTLAIATTHLLLNPAAVFLVYLAVDPQSRAAGIGGALFEHAWSASSAHLRERGCHPLGLVWEVDDPSQCLSPDEELRRHRRLHFFARHGGVLLAPRYAQPPLSGTEPVPMKLMYRPAPGEALPGDAAIQDLIASMYFEKYEAVNQIPVSLLRSLLRS